MAFFSVDIEGATEYKTQKPSSRLPPAWAWAFTEFFDEFPQVFLGEMDSEQERRPVSQAPPDIWRILGDEIVFTAVVGSEEGATALTRAFCNSVHSYDALAVGKRDRLRVRGTAWTAGFPIRNMEVPRKSIVGIGGRKVLRPLDYLGPDIDIGFRLTMTSRPGHVSVSMDLADLMTRQALDVDYRLCHVGWESFKGVFGGKPYPVIWLTGRQEPYKDPWVTFDCRFSEKYDVRGGHTDNTSLRKLIDDVRAACPELDLVPPYIGAANMPPIHQAAWEEFQKNERLAETDNQG